ncbi:helix-turn-helix domain-containing protein [Ruania albidiflava]|uniref:helix-turn-helix domain-containing protein n=1 Tax=Ruania albidiflava TaxID=366586 RepID=UPI0003B4A46D|nr:XRE family transcriptional regulator [Ruania albidiflava]
MTAGQTELPRAAIATSIQRERHRVGISLTELARRAGVAKSTLSQLESGTGNPSLETMWALAVALGVPFSQLLDPPPSPVQVLRAGQGPAVAASEAEYVATLLSASPPGVRRDLYRITAEPGSARLSDPHAPGTIEHVYLAGGRAVVGPADAAVELAAGDFITYPGDEPHIFEAHGGPADALLVSEQR